MIVSPVGRLQDLSFDFLSQAFPDTISKGAICRQTYADAKAMQDVAVCGGSKDRLRYCRGEEGKHKGMLSETGQFKGRRVEAKILKVDSRDCFR